MVRQQELSATIDMRRARAGALAPTAEGLKFMKNSKRKETNTFTVEYKS
jgi:hypothetical protein